MMLATRSNIGLDDNRKQKLPKSSTAVRSTGVPKLEKPKSVATFQPLLPKASNFSKQIPPSLRRKENIRHDLETAQYSLELMSKAKTI
jgi:hypothetical protein